MKLRIRSFWKVRTVLYCNGGNVLKKANQWLRFLYSMLFLYSIKAMLKTVRVHRYHRYLIRRLSLKVVYLWRHVPSTAPPFILWWWNLETLFAPLNRSSPFIGELRCQAIQMEHGQYIAERIQSAVYIVRCLWPVLY
jgi:hypothetical protein